MSADSPRKLAKNSPALVRAQQVSDKSILESVVDFFQDVVPQAYSTLPKADDKDKILWAQFENCDPNDISSNPDISLNTGVSPPLLLTLAYTNGIQLWSITHSGDAQEVLSTRQGPVQACKILPNPVPAKSSTGYSVYEVGDYFKSKRPLVALAEMSGAGVSYSSVRFMSLKTGEEVHKITFQQKILSVLCNKRVVLFALKDLIVCYEACRIEEKFRITSCYPCTNTNPVALGSRWLAYADQRLVPVHQSCGGMTGDGSQSYAATVISAAKTITKGLTMFGETVANSFKKAPTSSSSTTDNRYTPGIVTIVDTKTIQGQVCVEDDDEGEGVGLIAHFPAHANQPVAAMQFDPSGTLLLTACTMGHNFHVFRIMVHPLGSSQGAIHHLYTLHRGDTTARIADITFTLDSRWVAVSTLHGTTHVFPITPYGGPITLRTHTSVGVVNKSSRFHKSAGLDDLGGKASGRHSPLAPSSSPVGRRESYGVPANQSSLNNNYHNPRLPPYPHAITVNPLVQIKQPVTLASVTGGTQGQSLQTESMCLAACFGAQRSWFMSAGIKTDNRQIVDSLYVMGWNGYLVEYFLDPHARTLPVPISSDKLPDDVPVEVSAVPRVQWMVQRSKTSVEVKAPLPSYNPLIQATDAVLYQQPTVVLKDVGLHRYDSDTSLSSDHSSNKDDIEDQWLSQVEIITHLGPHRRLWMGPQFSFKTYQNTQETLVLSSNSSSLLGESPETHGIRTEDIMSEEVDLQSLSLQPRGRSSPVAMPGAGVARVRQSSGSSDNYSPSPAMCIEAGSYDQSPCSINEVFGSWPEKEDSSKLRENLAEAMQEPSSQRHRDSK